MNNSTIMKETGNKNLGITGKIKGYMKNVTIDIFNYEKKVTNNIANYFNEIAEEFDTEADRINVRISKREQLSAQVYNGSELLKTATTDELINFFMGKGSNELFNLKEKVEREVTYFIDDYSAIESVSPESLVINISKPAQEVVVHSFHDGLYLDRLELNGLIKLFSA